MAITTSQLYIAASVLVVIILCVTIACLAWYFYWHRRRQGNGFKKLPSFDQQQKQQLKHPIVNTPTIDISTVKFTVPTTNNPQQGVRPYSWAASGSFAEVGMDGSGGLEGAVPATKDHRSGSIVRGSSESNLGLLKPELYMTGDENDTDGAEDDLPLSNIGRVWFTIEYDAASEKLVVNVEKVRNLPGRQQRTSLALSSTSSCDPFLRLYLLPDEKRYLQSKMKRKTRSPTFQETFMFTMSYNLLVERTLRITVFDVDRFMRQTVIGHVLFPLEHLDITRPVALWRDVERSSQISSGVGRLQVGLTHLPQINRVAVNIIRGQKIGNGDVSFPDSYVKVTYSVLSKTHKVKKTSVHKASKEPLYNQTFEFKIDQQGMEVACFNFDVFHSTSGLGKNDKPLGSFIIGGGLCARGKELEHWTDMLQKPQTVVKEWHSLKS